MTDPQIPNDPTPGSPPPPPGRPPIDPRGAITPPPPPASYMPPAYIPPADPPRRPSWLGRIATGLASSIFIGSIFMNIYFLILFSQQISGPKESVYLEGDQSQRIAILPIDGMIDDSTAKFVNDAVKHLRKAPPKALILRVNSSGGGVSASDRIWYQLKQLKQETNIPIVASFASIATSGGYYIAMPADHIVAEPTTITGSIGVIAQAFTVHELLEKIGVQPEIIAATDATKKDRFNPARPWTEEDREELRVILDEAHNRFIQIVDEGRTTLDTEQVKKLATGEIFTSQQAQENQLVDEEGYLDAAIDKAKTLANIDATTNPHVIVLSPSRGLGLLGQLSATPPTITGDHEQLIRRWLYELGTSRFEYRWSP